MDGPRETSWAPMNSNDVLAVLVEDHRHQFLNDPEADPGAVLTLNSTVSEWR